MNQRLLLLLLPLLMALGARAQTTLSQESFETDGAVGPNPRYTANTVLQGTVTVGTTPSDQYFQRAKQPDANTNPASANNSLGIRASGAGVWTTSPFTSATVGAPLVGNWFWAGEAVRGSAGRTDRPAGIVTLTPTTTTGYRALQVKVALYAYLGAGTGNWEADDTLKIQVRYNGSGPWVSVGQFVGDNGTTSSYARQDRNLDGKSSDATDAGTAPTLNNSMVDYTFDVPGTANTLQVRMVVSEAGISEEIAFDNIRVVGTAYSSATPVLASIESGTLSYPTAGADVALTSALTVTDSDNTTLTSAIIRVSNTQDVTNDVLSFTGTAATGNIAGVFNAAYQTLTLTSAGSTATLAQWQAALRLVKFRTNVALTASSVARNIIFTVTDPNGIVSSPVFRKVGYASTVAPTVTTDAASSVGSGSAVLGGNITADGGASLTERGVVYMVGTGTPTTANTKALVLTSGVTTGAFSGTVSGLTASTQYTVRAYAINSVGTSYGSNVTFTTAAPVSGTTVVTNVSCFGGSNGTINLTPSGGVAPYTFNWGNGITTEDRTGLTAGTYSVTITDAFGATSTVNNITVTQPTSPVSGTTVVTNVSCFGGSNGSINLTPNGGTGPYTYNWGNGITTEDRTGLTAGTYSVQITDQNGCTGTVSATVGQPAVLATTGSQTNVSTNGGSDGSATVMVSGGAPGYTYSWSPSGGTAATASNLSAGTYTVTVTDANSCQTTRSFTITEPAVATVTAVTRLLPSPSATATVSYQVVFSGSVTGLTTSNFTLTTTGITGATVASVSGSGTTYTVAVNTGTGDGTLRLNVANSTGITPTVTNVPYTAGQEYTITKSFASAPQLTIQGTGGSGGDVTAFVDVVQVLSGGTAFANGLQNGSFETHDALANGNYGYNPSGASWTFNTQAGIAESGSAFSPVTPIPDGIAVAFVQSGGGTNGQLQLNLALPTGSNYTVSFQASQRNCCNSLYDQALNVFLNGVFLGTVKPANTNAYTSFTSPVFAVTAPALTATISSTAGANNSTTGTSPIPFTVTFSQAVTGFDASDVTVGNGTVTGGSISGSGTTYTFDVTPSGNGLVTVNVPANGAVDANNTGNTAATGFNITYSQPVTAAPVVTAPANSSLANNPTPTYSGTAPDGSTVTVYVDNSSIGTTTATGGSFSLTQPTPLAEGAHTVYATAQTPGSTVSPNSNTNTFTVDTTRPTVVLTSSTDASGTATATSPFAFTATFTEPVTGFVAGDLLVTNGTVSGFSGSGTSYTFTVTPTTAGTATTVTVFGNSSQDAANNGNLASNTYALTFAPTSVTWNGSVSPDWYTAGNWTPAIVPTTTLNATIPTAAPRMPLIATSTASVRHLTIASGATLDQTGGTLNVAGNLTTNGTFTPTGGTSVLGSTALTNLLGSSRVRFWNLTVNSNTAQVSTSAGASVRRLLTLTGNLNTNGNDFVLESDATGTAMVVNSGGSVVGTATVQRYIDPSLNAGLGYRHYSSPVQTTTVADLGTSGFTPVVNPAYNTLGSKTSPFPTVFGYEEARIVGTSATTRSQNYGYFSPANLNTPLEQGRGYTVNLRASEKVDLVGTLNTGTIAVGALSRGNQANSGWHLLGNPYPAPLDWTKVRQDLPDGVRDAVYVFKSSDQYNGTYQFFANGFGTLPGGLIPSMQGFFIRVTQAVPAFSFLSTWRATTYSNPTFQRTTADTRPALQLELVSAKGVQEPTFVYFEAGATAEVDNHYDAEKLLNTTGLNLSSVAAGTNLAINGLPPTAEATIVPLTVQVPAAGTYALRAAELRNLATQPVSLHDAVTGQQINLQQQSAYSFSTSGAAQLTGRFSLHFGALVPTGSASAALAAQVSLYPNPASTTVTLLAPRQLVGNTSDVQVLNSLGQVVRRQAVATTATGLRTELSLQGLAQGVYTVRLETNGDVVNKRLVIH